MGGPQQCEAGVPKVPTTEVWGKHGERGGLSLLVHLAPAAPLEGYNLTESHPGPSKLGQRRLGAWEPRSLGRLAHITRLRDEAESVVAGPWAVSTPAPLLG